MPEVYTGPGTTVEDTPPWMTYAAEMQESITKELAEEIAEYASHHYEDGPVSSQTQEELAFQREVNAGVAKEYQWVSPEEYEYVKPRIGNIMHSSVFINKLRKDCHLDCWYNTHPHPDKATLVVNYKGEPQVACWVQLGFMCEYEILRFDDHGIPVDSRRRGWRTCTLQMILKGMLSESLCSKVFGEAQGPACHRYNSTLQNFRNRGLGWEE